MRRGIPSIIFFSYLLFHILVLNYSVSGQIISFEKSYDTLGCYYSNCVQENVDKGFILCGSNYSSTNAQNAAIVRIDSLGNLIWVKIFGTPITDGALRCLVLNDSSIIIAGVKEQYSSTDGKIWIFKLDQNGNMVWENTLKIFSGRNEPKSLEQCKDGGFILSGSCNTAANALETSFLLKIDSSGNFAWSKTFINNLASGYSAIETTDRGYILTGSVVSGNYTDIFVLKTDSLGDSLWAYMYGSPNFDTPCSIKQDADSNFIIAGITSTPNDWNTYLLKLTVNGNFIWDKICGDSTDNIVTNLTITTDGNYLLSGSTGDSVYLAQIFLLKVDTNGDTLWNKKLGGLDSEFGYYGIECSDGGFCITGAISISQPPHDAMYVIKTDTNGSISLSKELPSGILNVFPNPTSDILNIDLSNIQFKKSILYIADILGKICFKKELIDTKTTLDVSTLQKGIYFINVTLDNKNFLNKLIKD